MGEKIQDNILFLGNRNDVNRIYQAMDVFVLPSRYEGLPVVAVEAQASGLPCVLSDRITEEVRISENVVFLDLEAGGVKWAEAVLWENKGRKHGNKMDKFEIKYQANKLSDYYSGLLRAMDNGNVI